MANQIVVSAGAKVRNLSGVLTGTTGVVNSLPINAANGIPQLDVNGKILVSQLPNSVMEYQGTWNAATNTPTLVNGTGNQGDVYLCNVAGTVNFGAGPIAFVVGDQVIYSGSIWQRASGSTGTVTSVAITETGDSLNITGSPITTSGTINIGFNGTNLQYVNGAGNLTTFPTLITSIGLSMPSAFSVANSPLTANGTIAVTGAGVASQYIRGDGTLADFPTSGGGGSSVSYYLNGGTSQGTIGGTTYYEMSKTAVVGTGVDFAKSGDGFIVAFLTDANDPSQLNIPAGNWNYEIYASMSSNGGTPQMYAELYKYDGTTFTLISTSSNEILYDGTALNLYTFAMAVPDTSLTLTDRLAVKLYATNSGGKTTTIHTQDGHLCQIITTFSTGITALNGLTAQVQYFQTGTSGTDFNISSTTATHTFNIPDASASARGLITTGTQTIAGSKTFTATLYGTDSEFSGSVLSPIFSVINGTKVVNLQSLATLNRDIYLPDASGTIALLEGTQTFTGGKTFDAAYFNGAEFINTAYFDKGLWLVKNGIPSVFTSLQTTIYSEATSNNVIFRDNLSKAKLIFNNSTQTFTFPAATGTLALTSDLTGGTVTSVAALTIGTSGTDLSSTVATSTTTPVITLNVPTASATNRGALSSADWTTFNNKQSALTNPVTGTGTTNYLPKFTGASTIGNSLLIDQATYIESTANMLISNATTYRGLSITTTIASARPTLSFVNSNYVQYGSYIQDINGRLDFGRMNYDFGGHTPRMTLDASGNLGLGVTPSAWAFYKAIQVQAASIANFDNADNSIIGSNVFYGGSPTDFRYISTGTSTMYRLNSGIHSWWNAPSGTAGNAISFTQAMTLDASGQLGIGVTTLSARLSVKSIESAARAITILGRSDDIGTIRFFNAAGTSEQGGIISTATSFGLMYNDVTRLSFAASTGAAIFSSTCTATGFFESSDSRLKTLIQDNYQTKGIASITPKLYTKNGKVELGYYAQDFVGVLDSAISKGSDDMLSLSYREVLVAKVYALEQRIKELENK